VTTKQQQQPTLFPSASFSLVKHASPRRETSDCTNWTRSTGELSLLGLSLACVSVNANEAQTHSQQISAEGMQV
jgi:hypothetical protein